MYTLGRVCQRGASRRLTQQVQAGIALVMSASSLWLVANWKMHGTCAGVECWVRGVNAALETAPAVACVFCPPAPYLAVAAGAMPSPPSARLQLGAQTCHAQAKGAFTGEVSASMLAEMGCGYVILGHSERRAMGESDAEISARVKAALAAGLKPILCVGESRAAYEAQQTADILRQQLALLGEVDAQSLLIAYEPVWAIGSGATPSLVEIQSAHRVIKSTLGSAVCVLYGGSVNATNIQEILALPEVSGTLIGGASLDLETMAAIISVAATVTEK